MLSTLDLQLELYRFVENQRKVKFLRELLDRANCTSLGFMETLDGRVDAFFIKLLEKGTLVSLKKPSKEMVEIVKDLSRKWAVKLAKLTIEDKLDILR